MGKFRDLIKKVESLADPDQRQHDNPADEITKADTKAREAREAERRDRGQK